MRLPYLRIWDNTPIEVSLYDGLTEEGAPNIVKTFTGWGNVKEKTKTIRGNDGQLITLNGVITIGCDIAPELEVITGHVKIYGGSKEWKVYNGSRVKNPDGSINHTKLELI
jgi:uncharacterized protein YaiE (UPF0345 family)